MGLVMGMPELETEAFLLVVVINKVELSKYGLDKPTICVRPRGLAHVASAARRGGRPAAASGGGGGSCSADDGRLLTVCCS